MSKLSITLKIAGGSYPFTIEREQEELYRQAERKVNGLVAGYSSRYNLLPKDHVAMAALVLAIENIKLANSRSLGEEIDRLAEIDKQLDDYFASRE